MRALASLLMIAAMAAPAFGQPTGGAPVPPARPAEDPERKAWLEEFEQLADRYAQVADQQNARMRSLLVREYNQRLGQLNQRYADRLTGAEKQKQQRQLEAIALLEKFIADHPNHELHTPDAMYRLAALYLDQAEALVDASDDMVDANYERSLALWERILKEFPEYRQTGATMYLYATYIGTRRTNDPLEERRAIQVYRAMVCHNKFDAFGTPPAMLEREEVQKRLESTTLVNPYDGCEAVPNTDPELILYGWVRGVAASHFATPGEMDEAIASYSRGLDDKSHKLYDEALYMLAWSYYRRDILDQALALFDQSVVRYDQTVAAGEKPALKLRGEAMQYIAVTLTDPWHGEIDTDPDKAWARAEAFYRGREDEPHVRAVWVTLGKAFADLGGPALDRAVDAYRKALGPPWHLHPDNPVVHQQIVNIYERRGDKAAANAERAELATRYSPCPPDKRVNRAPEDPCGRWYEANETNRKAMANYHRIGEGMLEIAALTTHQRAIDVHNEWLAAADGSAEKTQLRGERDELFNETLKHYRTFIETYPASKNIYPFTMGIAEVLFYLGRYVDQPGADGKVSEDEEGAVRHYAWVRDHRNLSSEFFEDSVFKIVKSYELYTDWLVSQGRGGLRPLEVPTLEGQLPAPQPIPEPHRKLQQAYDDYARLVNHADKAPVMAYNAGVVSLAYFHVDDAIARFSKAMASFCGQPEGTKSKEALLSIHLARQDDDAFRKVNRSFIKGQCGDAAAIAKAETQNRKLALKAAERLADTDKLADAAQAYYQYFHDAPKDDDQRAFALYHAAMLYENAGQPRRALYLFKEFSTRAESKEPENQVFRESPYRLPALRLYADSFGNSYEYQKAADLNLEIYKLASNPERYGVKPPKAFGDEKPLTFEQARRDALFNAAAFYELDRDFDKAVKYYKQYEKLAASRRDKDRAAWAVVRIYKSAGNLSALEKAWSGWHKTYGNDAGNELDKISAFYEIAKMYDKRSGRSNQRRADELKAATIKEWQAVNWANVSTNERIQAAKMAGEFDFELAEQHYQSKWVPAKITRKARTAKEAGKLIKDLEAKAVEAIKKYDEVAGRYKKYTLDYMVAAKVRIAKIYLDYNGKVFLMPVPRDVEAMDRKSPGFIAKYEQKLQEQLEKLGYRKIAEKELTDVVTTAAKPDVVVPKKWLSMAKDELNKEFQGNYPILNQELIEGTEEPQ